MTIVILFVLGYAAGGASALLLVGLALVSRRARAEGMPMELSYDIDSSAF